MIVTRRVRDSGGTCGALAPMSTDSARTARSGALLPTTSTKAPSSTALSSPSGTRTRRWPSRSAAAPSSGPASAVPMPATAALSPPRATESRSATTRVSTPTTIIANGSRAMKAIGK